ncbi:MAG: hypothetical protein H6710_07290 [Myxococcales bacterium]|nr:hypothetical protein [Myxococcales bacterium]
MIASSRPLAGSRAPMSPARAPSPAVSDVGGAPSKQSSIAQRGALASIR